MKHIIVAAAFAILCAACTHKDTGSRALWRRSVEPRLSTTREWRRCIAVPLPDDRAVAEAQCGPPPLDGGYCDAPVASREEVVEALLTRRSCTDRAIERLERLSTDDPDAGSDLAAAYYVRAQRNDSATDLLRALHAATAAVAKKPSPAALFNRALALEALELNDEAIAAWSAVERSERGPWADEAREHAKTLRQKTAVDAQSAWKATRAGIDDALQRRDRVALVARVAAFPGSATFLFENEMLPQYVDDPSPEKAQRLRMMGDALKILLHDDFPADVAAKVIALSASGRAADLRRAFSTYDDGAQAYDLQDMQCAANRFDLSATQLAALGCPFALTSRLRALVAQHIEAGRDADRVPPQMELLARDAEQSGYLSVAARIESNRFNALQWGHFTEAFSAWEATRALYKRAGDAESFARAHARLSGLYGLLGMTDKSFAEALIAFRDIRRVADAPTHTVLTGGLTVSSAAAGFPDAALLYENHDVDWALGQPPSKRNEYAKSVALRTRALLELHLRMYAEAAQDLNRARVFKSDDAGIQRIFDAKLHEVDGEAAISMPGNAVNALSAAIDEARDTAYLSYVALLHIKRAAAYRAAGQSEQAENDLKSAVDLLRREQRSQLATRPAVSLDWTSYFSRFADAYELLIQQLADENRAPEAFQYAEHERAFEPADLVLQLPDVPADFRRIASQDKLDLRELQRLLPPRTFIIEYRVLQDRTYAWIVSRDSFQQLRLHAPRASVDRWTRSLQDAARRNDRIGFDAGLEPPYSALLAEPLQVVRNANPSGAARLVIVPDEALHGLPFSALRDPLTKRYLIEDRTVAISGSALLYVYSVLRDRQFTPGETSALLVGDPKFDPSRTLTLGLPRLPSAEQEVREIRKLYTPAEVLIGADATAPNVLRLARNSTVIHIAAHAVTNPTAPSQSYLVFASGPAGDGIVDADTLMHLDARHTRLVILGACSSAGGSPVGAEGVSPLVRPLLASGVPGVIGSLWDVDDATAARLLVSFHRHYQKGLDAAAALQAAQLDELHRKAGQPALSWAPFQAIGYASSPFAPPAVSQKEKPP